METAEKDRIQLLEDIMIVADLLAKEVTKKIVFELVEEKKNPTKLIMIALNILRIISKRYMNEYPEGVVAMSEETDDNFDSRFTSYLAEYELEMIDTHTSMTEEEVHEELEEIAQRLKGKSDN